MAKSKPEVKKPARPAPLESDPGDELGNDLTTPVPPAPSTPPDRDDD